jgi:hypothetical protein
MKHRAATVIKIEEGTPIMRDDKNIPARVCVGE